MAFKGKQSPDTLSGPDTLRGVGVLSSDDELLGVLTPIPESTQQALNVPVGSRVQNSFRDDENFFGSEKIEDELDISAERERRQRLSTVPPPSRRPQHNQTAAFPGRAERRIFDGEKNSQPPPYARRLSSRPSVPPRESAGYYSLCDEQLEEVRIPRAPRVPLDFEAIAPELIPAAFIPQSEFPRNESTRPFARSSETSATIPTPPPSRGELASRSESVSRHERVMGRELATQAPEVSNREFARAAISKTSPETNALRAPVRDTMRSTIPPPSRSQVTTRMPESRLSDAVRSSEAPPRIYFSPHVRRQANDWAETGSLSIPGCSSPRHARALQRALLLALLTDPGWEALPQGLQQRAGWLFSEGWESNLSEGRAFREVDDLATILSLDATVQSRSTLSRAVAAVVPPSRQSRRSSEFPPSSRR